MTLSRRRFLEVAAGFPATLLTARSLVGNPPSELGSSGTVCVLLDFKQSCTLPESLAGFELALKAAQIPYSRAPVGTRGRARTLIAPAAALTDLRAAQWLRTRLEGGVSVLFESGAAFLPPREFASQQRWLQSHLGVAVNPPLKIWEEPQVGSLVPYLDYAWPLRIKVRDFSSVIPVSSIGSEAVAWFGENPVALRRKVGRGSLLFLGSPIGPHLLSGDPQAQRWLIAFITRA